MPPPKQILNYTITITNPDEKSSLISRREPLGLELEEVPEK
jgi:hypothetical protein